MRGRLVKVHPRTGAAAVALTVAGMLFLVPAARTAPVALVSNHVQLPANTHAKGGHPTVGWASSNWSGYALKGTRGKFTAVTGQWIVPTVTSSSGRTYSSSWVGIDGFSDSSLIQTGTEQDWYGGAAHYYAWWEILPAAETVIPDSSITVSPGDTMSASISQGSSGWTIEIQDLTHPGSFSILKQYRGQLTSAEWIEEAPSVGGSTATLANYGATIFDLGTANGVAAGLTSSNRGVMIQNSVRVSTPSLPDSEPSSGPSDGFQIAYGSSTPATPSS